MRYRAVLLDMDGTVLDTLSDLHAAVNHSLREFNLPEVSRAKVRASLGNGAARLIRCCLPESADEQTAERVLSFYLPYYDGHCSINTRPYEGIVPMMERLRSAGVKLAIISNKGDAAVRKLAQEHFPGLLEAAVGESATVRRKPNPDAVLSAAAALGEDITDCVYVGDSEVDIQTAKNAGMDCISVSWGFRDPEQLIASGAQSIADTPEALEKLIRG